MKLKDVREKYYSSTQKTSEIVRYLGLAGIGIIWMFRNQGSDNVSLPKELLLPAALLVIGLAFDLLHYVSGSLIWGIYNRHLERLGTKESDEFRSPRKLNWPTLVFFWGKIGSVLGAYCLILKFLGQKLLL